MPRKRYTPEEIVAKLRQVDDQGAVNQMFDPLGRPGSPR